MSPSNPLYLLEQMTEENEIIQDADSITEDMLQDYRNNCEDPLGWHGRIAADDEELLADIKQFNHTCWVEFAAETRLTHQVLTDLFMRRIGYVWGTAEEWGTAHYYC